MDTRAKSIEVGKATPMSERIELLPDDDFARVEYHNGKCHYVDPLVRLGRRSDRIVASDSTWIVPSGPFKTVYARRREPIA
jgi:hypothetical protein